MAIAVLAEPRVVGQGAPVGAGAAAVPATLGSTHPAGSSARPSVSTPDVARGPAVAGTNPARGISDAESEPDVDRANAT